MSQPPKTLEEAARSNDIEALYILLKINPTLLEEIDGIPFVDTPLHLAAASGSSHFAIEVLTMKPSFGQKLNPDGFSPMHVALRSGRTSTAHRLVDRDAELVRIKGKEGCTPLHYVAAVNDLVLLALFLEANPKAIQDLNIRNETAVHVAVKTGNFDAFKVLLGWLKHTDNLYILDWKDENGNRVLHIAVGPTTNNYEMVRLLIPTVRINERNVDGLTALDIARGVPNTVANARIIEKRLVSAGAKTSEQLPAPSQMGRSVPHYLALAVEKSPLAMMRLEFVRGLASVVDSVSNEARNNLLVVAGLIIAATYQAVLSPPGGLTSGDMNNNGTSAVPSTSLGNIVVPGKVNIGMKWYGSILGFNTVSFILSMGSLILLLPRSMFVLAFTAPLIALSVSYGLSYGIIDKTGNDYSIIIFGATFGIANIPFIWLKIYSCAFMKNSIKEN